MKDRFDPSPKTPDFDSLPPPDENRPKDLIPDSPESGRLAWFSRSPILWVVAIATVFGALLAIGGLFGSPVTFFFTAPLAAICVFLPPILTVVNFLFLLVNTGKGLLRQAAWKIECLTWALGIPLTALFYFLVIGDNEYEGIVFADWWEQIYTTQTHYPVKLDAIPTVTVLAVVGFAGYLLLRLIPVQKQPPLVTALAIAMTYLGAAVSVVWIVQIIGVGILPMAILPANAVLLYARTLRLTVQDKWRLLKKAEADGEGSRLPRLSRLFLRAGLLPVWGLLLALPLLGVLVLILTLFGQQPDAFIRAWTDTADWTLSQRIPPPSVPYDAHYLCTVAAGGHGKVVKPLRTGKRHGHEVIVNRQLCVANAFEQLLEERTPRFHRFVRKNYDRYGLPVARLIRTKFAADVVYILMKPAEWIFLAVLYLFDRKPENRIAVQYPHKELPKE